MAGPKRQRQATLASCESLSFMTFNLESLSNFSVLSGDLLLQNCTLQHLGQMLESLCFPKAALLDVWKLEPESCIGFGKLAQRERDKVCLGHTEEVGRSRMEGFCGNL